MNETTSAVISILLIEENSDDAHLIQEMLTEEQKLYFEITHTPHFEEGLELLTQRPWSLVLVSLALLDEPGLDGMRMLRKQAADVPIIVLAYVEDEPLALDLIHKGAESYVFREYLHSRELVRIIRCALERYRVSKGLEEYIRVVQNSHANFFTIVGKSTDGIVIVDEQGSIRFVNPTAERLFGRHAENLLGTEFGFPMVVGQVTETDIINDTGLSRSVEMRVEEIIWENETAYLATLHDITERKRSEHALLESEQRYRHLLGSVTDYIYTVEVADGKASGTTHGPNCIAITGYSSEDYAANPFLWYEMVHEQDRPFVLEQATNILSGRLPTSFEHRIIHKNGSVRWVRNTYVPRYNEDGQLLSYDGLVSDITERKMAEEEVRRPNAQLEQRVVERTAQLEQANRELRKLSRAIEQSPTSVIITDTNGRIEYVNPKFTQVTGYTLQEVLGKNPRLLKSGHTSPDIYRILWEMIQSGQEWRGEFHNRKKGGELYWELASISPITNTKGEITHFLAVKEDITERKKAEAELTLAREAAEAATRAKSEFLASMSHEIRTPLNAIIGMTTLLLTANLPLAEQDYVETIRICGESLLDIINDILDFSKIEAGKLELQHEPFNLCECIDESMSVVVSKASEKQLDLAYRFAQDTPLDIIGDASRLRQICVNLLSNAVKFTAQGEIIVSISTEWNKEKMLDCSHISPSRVTYHLAVRDTGIGIPKDRLDRLFQSFSQVDASITRRYGGTGLGLAISKRLAEMMGGTMWVESEIGKGSTFHFTICVEVAATQPNMHIYTVQPRLQGKHMLVIDDNPTICSILAQQLQLWGIVPRTTTSVGLALEWLAQGMSFDSAILDMHMPHGDSLNLAHDIRAYPQCQSIPLLLMATAGTGRAIVHNMYLSGVFFLPKPFSPLRLYDMLISMRNNSVSSYNTVSHSVPPNASGGHVTNEVSQMGNYHPLRILVAEDNPFNQKVSLLLLETMGYQADIVSNGLEVLSALEQRMYDVILMDVQMANMDGIETTQHIRTRCSREKQPYIIAMTAHALAGDREQCLAAGMNDYVSKPVRLENLTQALLNAKRTESMPSIGSDYAGNSSVVPYVETATPLAEGLKEHEKEVYQREDAIEPTYNQQPAVDLNILETFLEAIDQNTPEMKKELIDIFLSSAPLLVADIRQAVEKNKSAALYQAAHTLKSSSAQLGATLFANLCNELERMGKYETMSQATTLVASLEHEFTRVQQTMEQIKNQLQL